jgi:hypothetical protein
MEHNYFKYGIDGLIVALIIFIIIMVWVNFILPALLKVRKPLTEINFGEINFGCCSMFSVAIEEMPGFMDNLAKYNAADFIAVVPYKMQVGYYPDAHTGGGSCIFQEMECPGAASAYITACVIKYVLQKKIKSERVFIRISKI